MKKSDLRQLIKPLVKECIQEVLIEEGYLSTIVSEVAKGMQGNLVVEQQTTPENKRHSQPNTNSVRNKEATRSKLHEQRKKMMDSIGLDAYNGVNLFEGTEPIESGKPSAGSADLGSASDPGVDISSLIGGAANVWNAIK